MCHTGVVVVSKQWSLKTLFAEGHTLLWWRSNNMQNPEQGAQREEW